MEATFVMKNNTNYINEFCTSGPPEVFFGKGILKICSKVTGEHPCESVIYFNKVALHFGMRVRL